MQQRLAAAGFVLIAAAAVAAAASTHEDRVTAEFEVPGDDPSLSLEVADSPREIERGLMFRSSLAEDRGMLFVFPDERRRVFWMKNTYIPLDIIFLDSSRTVVDVDRAEPEPDTPEEELTRYWSDSPAKYVIETNRGFSREHGIEEGTVVSFNLPR